MTRATAATVLCTAVGLLAASPAAAREADRVRVAVLAERDASWQSEGLARAVLAHLARAEAVLPANPAMAGRLVRPAVDAAAAAEAARLLRARWAVALAIGGAGEARARVLDADKPAWRRLTVGGEGHKLPGGMALALGEAMGLRLSEDERARMAEPLVASAAAMEALWRGDAASDPAVALRYYRRAVQEDPESAAARNQLGTALARLRRWEDALDAFDKAIALQADSVAAHTNRSLVLKRQARWEEAESALRRAIELGTKSPTPYVALARLLDRKGAAREAVEQLERAVELDPSHVPALMALADVYFAQQHFKAARRRVDRVLELEPKHVPALNLLGLLELVPRRYEASEDAFRKALAVEPESAGTLANLGLALYGQKRVTEAIASIEQALAADRQNATAHFYLGRIYLQEERFDEAAEALQRAVEFAPGMQAARQALQQARARRRSQRGGGCGCVPTGALPGLAGRLGGSGFPVALLLGPHVLRFAQRRRRRRP